MLVQVAIYKVDLTPGETYKTKTPADAQCFDTNSVADIKKLVDFIRVCGEIFDCYSTYVTELEPPSLPDTTKVVERKKDVGDPWYDPRENK